VRTPVYCRVTVLAPGRRVDVALPVDVPLAELVPLVLELLGGLERTARPDPWTFTGTSGGPMPPGATLDELGVLDGELLRLGPSVPPPPPPVFDDPADALAGLTTQAIRRVEPDRQRTTAIAVLGIALAAAVLLATAREVDPTTTAWGTVVLGGLGAVLALAWAAGRSASRDGGPSDAPHGDDRLPTLVPALCAVLLAAAAGWAALPGPPDAARLLLATVAAGTAAALGQVAVRVVAPALIAVLVVTVPTATATVVGLRFGVPTPALAAVTGAVALSTGPLLPRAVLRLAGLPRPLVPADAAGLVAADSAPDLLPPDELTVRAARAHAHLTGLSGGCALTAAVAAPLAATAGGWTGPVLAVVLATVLVLRTRDFVDPTIARVHLAAGIAAGVALVGLAASATGGPGRLACALVLLGAAAAGAGAAGRRERATSPVARRAVDVIEGVLTATALPLALAAAGVFVMVRSL
jgi:type VII secretion integral membrane protein EccD